MGWLGQYLYVVPSTNTSITTMGSSWGSSLQCPLGNALPTDPVYNDGYDDGYSATEVWLALNAAVTPATNANGAIPTGAAKAAAKAADQPHVRAATRSRRGAEDVVDRAPKHSAASSLNRCGSTNIKVVW